MVVVPEHGVAGWPPLVWLLAANMLLVQWFVQNPNTKWINSGMRPGALAGHCL